MIHKRFKWIIAFAMVFSVLGSHFVAADDNAARDWSVTPGFQSPNRAAVDFSRAREEYKARKGLLGNQVTYTDKSTTTTNCQVAGSCQTNDQTNINGYTSVTVENSDDVEIVTETSSDNTDQGNTATQADSVDIGDLAIN